MIELTEDERDWIADVWDEDTTASAAAFYPVVARIIAARVAEALAPVRELADEWERLRADDTLAYASRYIADIRAALPDDGLHDLDDVAAEFGVNLTDNEETP